MIVVPVKKLHTSSSRGMVRMGGINKPKAKVICVGRQEPSKEALDRFIEIYLKIVEENERKARKEKLNNRSSDS